jgi:hypothetical protein
MANAAGRTSFDAQPAASQIYLYVRVDERCLGRNPANCDKTANFPAFGKSQVRLVNALFTTVGEMCARRFSVFILYRIVHGFSDGGEKPRKNALPPRLAVTSVPDRESKLAQPAERERT